jgi:hypothetical protein
VRDPDRLRSVKTLPQLIAYLRDELDWPNEAEEVEDLTFEFSPSELGLKEGAFKPIRQLRRPRDTDEMPWGVFFLDLDSGRIPVGALRRLLRTLVRKKRANPADRATWELPDLLFICSHRDESGAAFSFVHFDQPAAAGRSARLTSFGWSPHSLNRTALELNLPPLRWPAVPEPAAWRAQWRKAFDVQAVTKKFYKELANWYFWAREVAVFPKDAPLDAEGKPSLHLIRLLTRLIFCWFLKQKRNPKTGQGLIPDALFDPAAIKELLKDSSENSCTYYTAILQNLFFATLNTEMDKPGEPPKRRFLDEGDGRQSDDHMVHTLWRHAGQMRDPEALAALLRGIPFLNGGLFECLDDRVPGGRPGRTVEVRIDGFSNFPQKQPKLPNFLFFGPERTEDLSGAYGDPKRRRETVRPLLDILNGYNFTLTENTPLDQEVALDPELLGHVFENLLATYNPETGKVARKATGSFYTPRAVVDWMVDRALTLHLGKALGREEGDDPRLQRLLSWEEGGHEFSPAEADALLDAVDGLKALDPACGSGAFPMGLLQKLVLLLRKLDPHNEGWRRRQEAALDAMPSAPAREEARAAIARAFARDHDDYGRKLGLIENCLYGVDIQPIACQITKLRFFISLIVDQAIDPSLPNYGILPLPNLETKVVAADTLMGLKRGQLRLGAERVKALEEDLRRVRHDYFTARRYRDKKALRERDRELCAQLADALAQGGEYTPFDSKRLAEWNPYDTTRAATFFDPEWMFGLPRRPGDGCFDILLGNPPYVRQEDLKGVAVTGHQGKPLPLKDALKEQYECFTGTADLYVYFFERAFQLLKTGGTLAYITSNKYFRAAYGERLRAYLLYATRPSVVLDFGDAPVFTSIAYPCIIVAEKTRHVDHGQMPSPSEPTGVLHPSNLPPKDWRAKVFTWPMDRTLEDFPYLFEEQAQAMAQRELKPDGWRLESPVALRLLERLRKAGTPLGEYVNGRFYRGILTGLNEAFVVDRATRDRLIAEHPSSKEVLKPFLRGRDVKRWRCEFADQYLIKIESSENKQHPWSGKSEKEAERVFAKTYPAVQAFFQAQREKLIERYDQGKHYWELRSCDYYKEFTKPKVLYQEIATYQAFAWDDSGAYTNNKTFLITGSTKYLLLLLNSPICWWFLGQVASKLQGGAYAMQMPYLEQVPVPLITSERQSNSERIAETLIWLHGPEAVKMEEEERAKLIAFFERWLNGLVYELFFPDDLHARKLNLFDATAKLNPPDLAKLPAAKKSQALLELSGTAQTRSPIPAMLDDLHKIEPIRIIEGL